ncbi:MAG: AI-2E family transporter [Candidatus Vogelbacteria bacterium]|nr:AI-2E family transporter [Candidatus Vogelbacteria bacterium]
MKNENTTFDISITTGTIVKGLFIFVLVAGLYYLSDLVLIILTSVVIASSIEPMTKWFIERGLPRVPSVIILYVITFLVILGSVLWFVPLVFDDMFKLFNTIPESIKTISFDDYVSGTPGVFLEGVKLSLANNLSLDNLFPAISVASNVAASNFVESAKYVFGGMLSFILVIVISFYLAVQEKGIDNFLRLISHIKYEKYIINLWERSQRKIGLWMQGQILLALLIGVFVFLGLSVLGIKHALALALIAALFEIIPVFGPILAAAPGIIIAFTQSSTLGFMAFGLYVIIQQFENHLIYPLVVRKVVGVPPLLVVLAIIVGADLAGLLGAILAVPGSAVLMELVKDIEQRKRTNA